MNSRIRVGERCRLCAFLAVVLVAWAGPGRALYAGTRAGSTAYRGGAVGGAKSDAARLAEQILRASGVRGGLVVHIGCGRSALTAALRASDSYLVHGLDRDAGEVAKAREHIRSLGLYGPVSVDPWTAFPRLPYADGLVNLLVVSGARTRVQGAEIARVLAPGGVALVGGAEPSPAAAAEATLPARSAPGPAGWTKIVKPRPTSIDDWTHTLHDASNNAVAADTQVGPPHHLQWVAGPRNARHHERLASITVVVSAGGRLFYIVDEAPAASILLRPAWALVARDAFSGVALWKRAIPAWQSHLHAFRMGPPALGRRLVAAGRRVYVTLGLRAPVTALDAATGKTRRTYKGTEGAEEILHHKGTLYLVCPADRGADRRILAVDADSGNVLWQRAEVKPMPLSLTVGGPRVFYLAPSGLVALDAKSGREIWRAERTVALKRPGWSAPTVVASPDASIVICADRQAAPASNLDESTGKRVAAWLAREGYPGDLVAYSADSGKELWRCRSAEAYHAPIDVFIVDNVVWYGQSRSRTGPDFTAGRDLRTGKIVRRMPGKKAFETTMPHHRCHRNRATRRYLVVGRTGVEFIDLATGAAFRHHWTRGTCQFGTLPCNGLLYVPPHACACYIEAKLTGFLALAPKRKSPPGKPQAAARLERGPAYPNADQPQSENPQSTIRPDRDALSGRNPQSRNPQSTIRNPQSGDWPTHRHDAARSGCARTAVPAKLHALWRARAGGRLTSPVIADGVALVASVDAHTVHAFRADTGEAMWRFTTGGRVDSPPSIAGGRTVFGSADGCVYCLRLADGKLAWRFRAAPAPRRIVAFGQVECVWPVHGSVLIRGRPDGPGGAEVLFAAGRSSYLDDGLLLYRLDLKTGRVLARRRIYSREKDTGAQPGEPMMFEMPGALPDVLSSDDERVYMRRLAFDPRTLEPTQSRPHLYSPAGLLNGDWWHRTYWIYGDHFYSGYIGWYFAGRENAAGRLLAVDDERIYGYGYTPSDYRGLTGRQYHLFAADRASLPDPGKPDYRRANRDYPPRGQRKFKVKFAWRRDVDVLARAMVLAVPPRGGSQQAGAPHGTVFLAGPPERALRSTLAFQGKRGTMLTAVSAEDGKPLATYRLDALPVFDGLAAARGRLFISLRDGTLRCLGGARGPSDRPLPAWSAAAKPTSRKAKEPGLVGHWPLDEGAGAEAADQSGLGNDAEVNGRWVKGAFGACVHTRGTPGAVTVWDSPAVHFSTSSFSIAFWVKVTGYDRRLLGKEDFPRTWWVVNLLRDGRAEMVLGTGRGRGQSVRPTSKSPLVKEKWTHVAFAVDRSKRVVTCYINGEAETRTKIPPELTGSLSVEGKDLRIPSLHKPFVGLFDELRLYKRTLTAAEVKAVYESEKANR